MAWGALAAYILGSVPVGLWLLRAIKGVDVREYGSGNIGTINVLRVAGPAVAGLVLLGDILKGAVPVIVAETLGAQPWIAALWGFAAILGHNWSLFLGFSGGKGVATSLGFMLGISPWAALVGVVTWTLLVIVTRYSSVGSMSAGVAAAAAAWYLQLPPAQVSFAAAAALLILLRHHENIGRLIRGEELKFNARVDR